MSREVLLINTNRLKPAVGPIGLDYAADCLEASGFRPKLLDLCLESDTVAALDAALSDSNPLLIGMTLRNTDDCYLASGEDFVPAFAALVAEVRQRTEAPIVIGGGGFSLFPEAMLETTCADYGIAGDGEVALAELAGCVAAHDDPGKVPGLVWRDGGASRRNSPWTGDVSALPERKRSLVDNGRYLREGGQCGLETKRGCDRGCIYCADPVAKGRRVRPRSPAQVADEFETLAAQGVDYVHLCDSEFNVPVEHAKAVCEELTNRGLAERTRWYAYGTPAGFTSRLAAAMRAAGCVGVNFGVDSADDRMLATLGRDFLTEDIKETARACRQANLVCMFDLLLGGPGETRRSIARTIDDMKRISPDRVGVSLGVRIYPGTKLASLVGSSGPLDANPDLRGSVSGNQHLLKPVFFLSAGLGEDVEQYVADLVGGDERFFFPTPDAGTEAYNYSDNDRLVEAIRQGHRGAYWDILRRLSQDG